MLPNRATHHIFVFQKAKISFTVCKVRKPFNMSIFREDYEPYCETVKIESKPWQIENENDIENENTSEPQCCDSLNHSV